MVNLPAMGDRIGFLLTIPHRGCEGFVYSMVWFSNRSEWWNRGKNGVVNRGRKHGEKCVFFGTGTVCLPRI